MANGSGSFNEPDIFARGDYMPKKALYKRANDPWSNGQKPVKTDEQEKSVF